MSKYAMVSDSDAKLNPYPYVCVEKDGSIRELGADERVYFQTKYHPVDGAQPYTKDGYGSKDGGGGISGYLERKLVPDEIEMADIRSQIETDDVSKWGRWQKKYPPKKWWKFKR